MLSLRYLLRQLEPFMVHVTVLSGQNRCPQDLELLDSQAELLPDRIYLGDATWAEQLKAVQIHPGAIVMLAGAKSRLRLPAPGNCTLVLLSCSLPALHNLLAQNVRNVETWSKKCHDLLERDAGIHEVLRMAARLGGCGAVLLDRRGYVISSAGLENGSYLAQQLSCLGTLPPEIIKKLFPPGIVQNDWGRLEADENGLTVYACRHAMVDGEALGMLLMEARETDGPDIQSLCACVMECLHQRLVSWNANHVDPDVKAFQRFWEDVMERRLINRMEIRSALSNMPCAVQDFLRVVVISFKNNNIHVPYNYFLSRLREFFPNANMAVYCKDIILLYSHKDRDFRPSLGGEEQIEQLTALLKRYDGFMMIGNGTHHAEAIASMYLLSKRTCELACLLRQDKTERIFFAEDYIIYSIIDLCAQRYLEAEHNEDILYLAHPAVAALTRYDRLHNTDLRDLLFHFLLYDGNVLKTASAMYMHRNTVNNKVNQIKKLTKLELDDPRLRQRLLLSCQIMRYYEIVMQKEMQ